MWKLKKISFLFFLTTLTLMTGCNPNEPIAEGIVEDYYESLINESYEEVYEVSSIYDLGEPVSKGTTLSEKEAKSFFKEKVRLLQQANYKVESYEIVEIHQQDGHTFTYEVLVEIKMNGETIERKEEVATRITQQDLAVTLSEDPLAKYRDGRVNFSIEKHWEEDIEAEYNRVL